MITQGLHHEHELVPRILASPHMINSDLNTKRQEQHTFKFSVGFM